MITNLPTRDELLLEAAKTGLSETEAVLFLSNYKWRVETGRTTTVSWRRAMAVWAAVTRACKAQQPVKTEPYDR